MSKQIEVKRTALAFLKSIGKSNAEIATKYGIKESEVKTLMVRAGLVKSRSKTAVAAPEYFINYIDDSTSILGEEVVSNCEMETTVQA